MDKADHPALEEALRSLGLEDAVLESSETRATDAMVWRVRYQENSLAIRVLRPDQAPVVEIESTATRQARSAGVPAPQIVSTATTSQGQPVMATDWLNGDTVGDALLRNPRLARRIGFECGEVLARIHGIPHPVIPDGAANWIQRAPAAEQGLRTLLESTSARQQVLLHLDFHPFNLITQNNRIRGVLDWTNASLGDPRADIARSTSIMQLHAPALLGARGATRMTIGLFTRAFLDGYQYAAGPLHGMAPFYAWAGHWMLADLQPKLDDLQVSDPIRFNGRVKRWTAAWMKRALSDSTGGVQTSSWNH
jgi:aminoglycoside phosphotransferase (APT) family kinase protein